MLINNNYSLDTRILGLATATIVGFMSILPSKAMALGFTGPFEPSNWSLTNNNANGSVDTTDAANGTIILTGGDNGTNLPGTTDWTISIDASSAGPISFNWSYLTTDAAGFDSAGYLLNGVYTSLALQDGDASTFPVFLLLNVGDVFGFRAATNSNSDGPPIFTVSDFTQVPESSSTLGLLTLVGLGITLKRKC